MSYFRRKTGGGGGETGKMSALDDINYQTDYIDLKMHFLKCRIPLYSLWKIFCFKKSFNKTLILYQANIK